MKELYDVVCRDECGHEMVISSGITEQEAINELKDARENYPECSGFRKERNARQMAEDRCNRDEYGMSEQDYYDDANY